MVLRNHLQHSVCSLCILAIVSFFMIFVVSLILMENLHDKIELFTPLTMLNQTAWAQIPGTLNYTYSKQVYLFSIQAADSATGVINMTHVGPFNYTVDRQFVDPVYDNAKKVVNYTMEHSYTLNNT